MADADMSTPWVEVLQLARLAREQAFSVVIGSRGLAESRVLKHQYLFRESLGKLFNVIVRVLTGLPYKDTQCGFKLFEKRAVKRLAAGLKVDRFAWDVEFLLACRKAGLRIAEVPVTWENSEQTHVRLGRDSLEMLFPSFALRCEMSGFRRCLPLPLSVCPSPPICSRLLPASSGWIPASIWPRQGIRIPYAPGFPFYVILTHLAGLVPVGAFAQRIHFVSAVAGAGTCLVVYLTVRRFSVGAEEENGRFAGPLAALLVALGTGFPSRSGPRRLIRKSIPFTPSSPP